MALDTNCDLFTVVGVLQSYASNCMVADRVAIAAAFPKCNDCEYDSPALRMDLYVLISMIKFSHLVEDDISADELDHT